MRLFLRVLCLILCPALLIGAVGLIAGAEDETVFLEENFDTAPVNNLEPWEAYHTEAFTWMPGASKEEGQHVKLVCADKTSVNFGYVTAEDYSDFVYEWGKIAAKDLTFEAKLEADTDMQLEFFVLWDLYKSDGTVEVVARRIVLDIVDGKILSGGSEVGFIPEFLDTSAWNTWTIRCSRQSAYSGTYDVQLLINGVNYLTGDAVMSNQGSPVKERFAIHGSSFGFIEIDNIKIEELYLDAPKGAVVSDSVRTPWSTGFGAVGDLLIFDEVSGSYTPDQWKKSVPAGTEVFFVGDDDAMGTKGGYLNVALSSSAARPTYYANRRLNSLLPDGQVIWFQVDVRQDGDEVGFQLGMARLADDGTKSGRRMSVSIRPDGLYYANAGNSPKADFAMPDMSDWTTLVFRIDPQAQKVTVYANGIELGKFTLDNIPYSETGTNFTHLKITANRLDYTGSVQVDNIKVSCGGTKNPPFIGDASCVTMAAAMLPVSGLGLCTLLSRRKKEN